MKAKKTFGLVTNLLMGVLLLSLVASEKATAQQQHYNVLMIAVDDMSNRVSFLGNPEIKTPNLDRLATMGMVFTNANVQYPICNPSRTSLLLGFRPDKTEVFSNSTRPRSVPVNASVVFLPEYFKNNGYTTTRKGKIAHGTFESDIYWDDFEPSDRNDGDGAPKNARSANETGGEFWIEPSAGGGPASDSVITAHTLAWLSQPQPQPFFYGFGLHTHNPFNPSLKYWNLHGDSSIQELLPLTKQKTTFVLGNGSANIMIPQTPINDLDDIPVVALTGIISKSEYEWKKTIHAYDGEVSQFDARLGLVLDKLDSLNLWQNTIVVFWSDHGQHLGEHNGLWLKNTLFNESLNAPFIVCMPGKSPGVCDKLIEYVDLYPTLAELCGLPVPPGMEGSSFAKLLDNPNLPWKKAIFSQVSRNPGIMGRNATTELYSYNSWQGNGEELYDRINDPKQWTNLVSNPQYASVLDSMRTILAEGWTQCLPPTYVEQTFYVDMDGDGYGTSDSMIIGLLQPTGYAVNNTDCNDTDSTVHPNAIETCDGIDNDCDSLVDEGSTFYPDTDGDGYGNGDESSNKIVACEQPSGFVLSNTDCNDSDTTIHPGAIEICNGMDDNCNGQIDEGLLSYFYIDTDNDGYGSGTDSLLACTVPAGYSVNKLDCNNTDASIYPGAVEICDDGKDNNCSSLIDEKPTAKITVIGNLNICGSDSVVLQANTAIGYNYKWKLNNVTIVGAISATYVAKTTGSYKVVVTTAGFCTKTSATVNVTKTCLQQPVVSKSSDAIIDETLSLLTISPIPSIGKITINYKAEKAMTSSLSVYNIFGQKVYTKKESLTKGNNIFSLDISFLISGTYYLEINGNHKKIIIQK